MIEYNLPKIIPQCAPTPVITHLEIAESLDATPANVKRKILEMAEQIPEFKLNLFSFSFKEDETKRGPPTVVLALNQHWARFLVARYENKRGADYLRALIGLQTDVVPALMERIDLLTKELNATKQALADAAPSPKAKRLTDGRRMALIEIKQNDLWGNPTLSHRVWVPEEEASRYKVLEAKVSMAHKAARGLLNSAHHMEAEMNSGKCY